MFDHLGIVVSELERGRRFYEAILAPLGIRLWENNSRRDGTGWLVFSTGAHQAPFFVVAAGRPSFWDDAHRVAVSPVHICFSAPSREAVDNFHAIALTQGGRDNGAPGVRRDPFYCAFILDADGNNIEAGAYLERP